MSRVSFRREPTIDLNAALKHLRAAKFKCDVEDRGTIIAHRGDVHFGFSRRLNAHGRQCYSQEAILRAGQ